MPRRTVRRKTMDSSREAKAWSTRERAWRIGRSGGANCAPVVRLERGRAAGHHHRPRQLPGEAHPAGLQHDPCRTVPLDESFGNEAACTGSIIGRQIGGGHHAAVLSNGPRHRDRLACGERNKQKPSFRLTLSRILSRNRPLVKPPVRTGLPHPVGASTVVRPRSPPSGSLSDGWYPSCIRGVQQGAVSVGIRVKTPLRARNGRCPCTAPRASSALHAIPPGMSSASPTS